MSEGPEAARDCCCGLRTVDVVYKFPNREAAQVKGYELNERDYPPPVGWCSTASERLGQNLGLGWNIRDRINETHQGRFVRGLVKADRFICIWKINRPGLKVERPKDGEQSRLSN